MSFDDKTSTDRTAPNVGSTPTFSGEKEHVSSVVIAHGSVSSIDSKYLFFNASWLPTERRERRVEHAHAFHGKLTHLDNLGESLVFEYEAKATNPYVVVTHAVCTRCLKCYSYHGNGVKPSKRKDGNISSHFKKTHSGATSKVLTKSSSSKQLELNFGARSQRSSHENHEAGNQ
ncbi:hypothetical protein OGAPHI_004449 [Ogataea philodendri]|uniref:Uncharacterized protein n=1 Tax=Ogataea philodendri TaxID=1378263 RepID=A0A9P8T5N3_9ASCO|nr:uncharacterized protein OGAPHI_004449 [Ogataea philodendri]KAH3666260.1 hypothetical protein OGAPHI_004449 [Ogataea philodendri]